MTNEEKAKLISEQFHCDDVAYDAAEQMAEWKDEQFAEEKKDLRSLVDMLPMNENNQTIIEDLKALLS